MANPKKKNTASNSKNKAASETKAKAQAGSPKPKPTPNRRPRKKVDATFVFVFLGALISLFAAMFIQQPVSWAMHTTGPLLGETKIDSHEEAKNFADLSIQEATALWSEPSAKWQTMINNTRLAKNQLTVECRRVSEGPYAVSDVHLARAEGIFRGVTAQEAFDFMASPEGFAIMDPSSKERTDFYRSIERIPDWREGGGQTEIAELQIPGFGPFSDRHFLVLSSSVPEERILVAKSVLHSSRPGASAMYLDKEDKNHNGQRVRSVITFAIQVDPKTLANGEEVIAVKMISYLNLFVHESIMSFASCKWLFPDFYNDFQAAFDAKRHSSKQG